MTTRKIRAAAAVFAAALTLSVASGPLTSDADAAVKSGPTGNAELDSICQQMANLINQAYTEGDLALINGDDEGAEAWYELARDMLRRSRDAGCKMYSAKLAGVATGNLGGLQVSPGKTPAPKTPSKAVLGAQAIQLAP